MNPMHHVSPSRSRQRGQALAIAVHCVLLVVVLGQVVYLASRHRVRIDLTSDKLYSLTSSTRDLLEKLDKRLVVEAYVSPKDKLPVNMRESRAVADNFLDEIVQLGKGKVVVQRFDPNADKAITDKCTRIGVKPVDLRSQSATSLSVDRHWQGLRLLHGGKQKVIEQFTPGSSFAAEALLTPAIKEVTTETKHKYGYMEWPSPAQSQQQPGGIGWNMLRTLDQIAKRYEFQNHKDEDSALLPADLQTLFLFRPKDLTDRQKYVLDQFLMRGGTLVVFADAADFAIGQNRQFSRMPLSLDAVGSQKKFQDQLLTYGVDWKPKVVADTRQEAYTPRDPLTMPFEYLAVPGGMGGRMVWVPYPYFLHAMPVDWSQFADQLARDGTGKVDADVAGQYRKTFRSGFLTDDFLFKTWKQIGRSPGFYWPTWVGLREKVAGTPDLPEGVTGRVLLQTSPYALAEDPPASLDPLGQGDPKARMAQHQKFLQGLHGRFLGEPRLQVPLMVELRGTFPSFFADGDRPKRPSEIKEEEAKKAAAAKKAEDAEKAEKAKDAPPMPDDAGPPPPETKPEDVPPAPPEAEPLRKATAPGRIVMIGDADFIRDDFVRGDYRQLGGPLSALGPLFFSQLLDWLAEDRDLVELQSRVPVDRSMKFVDPDSLPNNDPRTAEQAVRSKTTRLLALNILLPGVLLSAFGFVVFLVRRGQKRSFHQSLSN